MPPGFRAAADVTRPVEGVRFAGAADGASSCFGLLDDDDIAVGHGALDSGAAGIEEDGEAIRTEKEGGVLDAHVAEENGAVFLLIEGGFLLGGDLGLAAGGAVLGERAEPERILAVGAFGGGFALCQSHGRRAHGQKTKNTASQLHCDAFSSI